MSEALPVGERESGLTSVVLLLWKNSVKYFSVEKRICNLMVYHVDCKNSWESGSFQQETGPIPSQHACRQCSEVWDLHVQSSPGSHLSTSPGELHWMRGAHKLGGLQHCWGTPEALKASQGKWLRKPSFSLLWLPWSKESQLILKTLNRTPVMDSCASRNLLLVPQKIKFFKFVLKKTQDSFVCLCVRLGGGLNWMELDWIFR